MGLTGLIDFSGSFLYLSLHCIVIYYCDNLLTRMWVVADGVQGSEESGKISSILKSVHCEDIHQL